MAGPPKLVRILLMAAVVAVAEKRRLVAHAGSILLLLREVATPEAFGLDAGLVPPRSAALSDVRRAEPRM